MSNEILRRTEGAPAENEQIRLASKVIARALLEGNRKFKRIAEITGYHYGPREALSKGSLLNTALRVSIDNSYEEVLRKLDPSLNMEATSTLIRNISQEFGVREPSLHEDDMRMVFLLAIIEPYTPASEPASSSFETRQVDEAMKIGAERNISPAMVYMEDDLYAELVRRTQTPTEIINEAAEVIDSITPEKIKQKLINMKVAINRLDQAIEPEAEKRALFEAQMQEMIRKMNIDLKLNERAEELAPLCRKVKAILTNEKIVRFWGQEAMDSLPPLKEDL